MISSQGLASLSPGACVALEAMQQLAVVADKMLRGHGVAILQPVHITGADNYRTGSSQHAVHIRARLPTQFVQQEGGEQLRAVSDQSPCIAVAPLTDIECKSSFSVPQVAMPMGRRKHWYLGFLDAREANHLRVGPRGHLAGCSSQQQYPGKLHLPHREARLCHFGCAHCGPYCCCP